MIHHELARVQHRPEQVAHAGDHILRRDDVLPRECHFGFRGRTTDRAEKDFRDGFVEPLAGQFWRWCRGSLF